MTTRPRFVGSIAIDDDVSRASACSPNLTQGTLGGVRRGCRPHDSSGTRHYPFRGARPSVKRERYSDEVAHFERALEATVRSDDALLRCQRSPEPAQPETLRLPRLTECSQ